MVVGCEEREFVKLGHLFDFFLNFNKGAIMPTQDDIVVGEE